MTKTPTQLDAEIAASLRHPDPAPMRSAASAFQGFDSWADVLAAARRGDRLWYHAPMDYQPRSIHVVKVFKNGNIRIDPLSNQADKFTADRGHLDRFKRRM